MSMDTPLATLEDLKLRLDWELDANEERVGTAALEDLSNEARFYGSNTWTGPAVSPPFVRTLVLKAAARYLKNIEGYVQSRAGDESVQWSEIPDIMGTASFTSDEQAKLSQIARPSSLVVAQTYAYSNRPASDSLLDRLVPPYGGGQWFPFLDGNERER